MEEKNDFQVIAKIGEMATNKNGPEQKETGDLDFICSSKEISSRKKPLLLSTSPYKPETHWKQSVLYLDNEIQVRQDSQISGSIAITPSESNSRFLNIQLSCQVEKGNTIVKDYFMGYEAPN